MFQCYIKMHFGNCAEIVALLKRVCFLSYNLLRLTLLMQGVNGPLPVNYRTKSVTLIKIQRIKYLKFAILCVRI